MTVTEDGLCSVAVTNCGPYPITNKQGSAIGIIKIKDDQDKIQPQKEPKVTEIFESINLVTAEATSSQKLTEEQIEQKVKLNV